jgi:flagellar hook-length control protein FliK
MTTDRTAAPTRGTALVDRAALGGRPQAPPTDAFSALLGAVDTKSDAPRGRERPEYREGKPRWDDGPRPLERRPQPPKHDEYRRPDTDTKDLPASDSIATSCDPEEPTVEEPAVTAVTPSLFALQLASPLPPAGTVPATAAAPTPTPATPATATPAATQPVLPILPSIVPASVATATATAPVTGEVAAATAEPTAAAPTATAAVAASALAAVLVEAAPVDGEVKLPENLLKPQAPGAPAQDAATTATPAQPQTGADADTSGQPDTPSPFASPTPTATAAATQPKAAADAPEPTTATTAQPVTPIPTTADVRSAASGLPRVERAVPLSRAVATTGLLLHIASERGVTHARLNLKPVELGGIEVKLHSTPAGIHAQLIADSPEAARMLAQAGDDLKRQLSDRDVNLLSLDVSTSADQRGEEPRFTDGFGDDHRPGGYPSNSRGSREDTVLMESPAAADTVLVLPDGVHVDVLA